MKVVGLEILLESPALLAASPPASNLTETLQFIPGNSIRGILARRYLDVHRADDAVFHRLFVSGETRFGFGFAAGSQPIPLSARSCKYDSGFHGDGGHGVLDILLREREERCPEHEPPGQVDYFPGFWDPLTYRSVAIKTKMITRTAIDRVRGTAESGRLFLQRVLDENGRFYCEVEVPEDLEPALTDLIDKPFQASLGTGASRGQGWVSVRRSEPSAVDWGPAAGRYERFRNSAGRPVLAVTFLTDGLFHDEYLRDKTGPSLSDLKPLGVEPADWDNKPARAFADTRMVFGFDGEPICLPRSPRLAVKAGSVFLFAAKPQAVSPSLPSGDGWGWIGDQNREGYGRAVLWHPFHVECDRAGATAPGASSKGTPKDHILVQAHALYRMGFNPTHIRRSQIARVSQLIARAGSIEDAKTKATQFLANQLKKGTSGESWNAPADKGETLGSLLAQWIGNEKYLPVPVPDDLNRLSALQSFWHYLERLYLWEAAFRRPMPLTALMEESR